MPSDKSLMNVTLEVVPAVSFFNIIAAVAIGLIREPAIDIFVYIWAGLMVLSAAWLFFGHVLSNEGITELDRMTERSYVSYLVEGWKHSAKDNIYNGYGCAMVAAAFLVGLYASSFVLLFCTYLLVLARNVIRRVE